MLSDRGAISNLSTDDADYTDDTDSERAASPVEDRRLKSEASGPLRLAEAWRTRSAQSV